jgi:hypothetical protein
MRASAPRMTRRTDGNQELAGKSTGLKGAAELFPWMLDGALPATSRRLLNTLPPPARLLYRALRRPGYARTPRWITAT